MSIDMTRSTFQARKHYSQVVMQQGRVQLDADWNEQMAIQAHLDTTTRSDVLGLHGAPRGQAGFAIRVDAGALRIGAGRYYVDGMLCENEEDRAITEQPDLPQYVLPTDTGLYLAYLDAWHRDITAIEDATIREVALGGPDTSTRTKTIFQVKLLRVGGLTTQASGFSEFEAWNSLVAPPSDTLRARAVPEAETGDPCILPPGAG